jgi:hypothetical protein
VGTLRGQGTGRAVVPLRERRYDLVFIAFFCLNLFFITYVVDIEQLTIPSLHHWHYPLWPPPPLVRLIHSYGRRYDPLLMARPAFWKMTIWIDVVFFGPFYAFAIYAFVRGREWIRVPAIFWAGMMSSNVLIILMEERFGVHRTPHFALVLGANLPWLLLPFAVVARMWLRPHPFTRAVASGTAATATAAGEAAPAVPAPILQ